MKKVLMTLMAVVMTMGVMAIPAKRGLWSTIQLANGTEVRVERVGDEHGHWLRAADGTCYVMNAEGKYVKESANVLTAKRQARLEAKQAKKRAIYASTSDGLGQKGKMSMGSVPSIGEFTIPVVMVQFSDLKFKSTTTVAKMNRYYNEEGYHDESGCVGSVRDYFKASSGGQFVPTFEVVGIVTLDKGYAYYGTNDSDGSDQHLDELPGHVISKAISTLGADFSKYVVQAGDENHTTGVPLLAMFYAGKGEATESQTNANSKYMWPCEWDDVEDAQGGNYNGVHFNSFFIGNELYTGGSSLMGMGVFCHEFGHALGLPDFYVTDYSYENDDPFGMWSIMDTGGYEGDSYAPMGYNAYEKSYMGWLELKEIGTAEEVVLQSPQGKAENSAYIIRNSTNETFIFENRQPGTFYPSEYGSGVLVTRIAYNYNQWKSNTLNNTQKKKRACVLTANGAKMSFSAENANLYGGSKTSIGALKTLSGTSMDANITKITKNNDGTITLTMKTQGGGTIDPDPTPGPGDDTPVSGVVFKETFDKCDGEGGNDDKWSGGMKAPSLQADNDGWTANDDKVYGANKCARFGKTGVTGTGTTPTFTLNGTATLTFRAGAWNASADGTTLELEVANGTVTPSSVTMTKGQFKEFTATVTGHGDVEITFAATKGRFFLDDVLVQGETSTAISTVRTQKAESRIFTLDGRYVGTDFNALNRGLYIVNGRKVVIK